MARGDCNITNICIPTRRIIYAAGFTPTPPPPVCNYPAGSFSQGGTICSWGYRVRWDISAARVPSDQANYLAYISLTELVSDLSPGNNALFWNDANRAEFRVTTSDGATEIPHYTSALDTVNETGYIWARVPSVSSSVTTSLFIYLANPAATEYAVGDPLGRNATFQDYALFYDFEQDPTGTAPQLTDITGNSHDGTAFNTWTGGRVTGKVGSSWNYIATSSRYVQANNRLELGVQPLSLGGWVKHTDTGRPGLFGAPRGAAEYRYAVGQGNDGATQNLCYMFGGSTIAGSLNLGRSPINNGAWRHIVMTVARSGNLTPYLDGIANGAAVAPASPDSIATTNNPKWTLGVHVSAGGVDPLAGRYYTGEQDIQWAAFTVLSADRIATDYANQNAPGTFATFTNFLANT